MAQAKNINVFLLDGEGNKRIKCTTANWTGVVYKIPVTFFEKSKTREELNNNGIYFLIGNNEIDEKPIIYIGQASARKNGKGIIHRILEHQKDSSKSFCLEAIAITTSNDSLGSTELSYLEHSFYNLAYQAKRYEVHNACQPSAGNISEEKESEMNEFIEYSKLLVSTLGYKIFTPLRAKETIKPLDENKQEELPTEFVLSRKNKKLNQTITASMTMTSEGWVVKAGSTIAPTRRAGISDYQEERRRTAKKDQNNILLEDELFKTPSGAASFVLGISVNGWSQWISHDGRSLDEIFRQTQNI